MPKNLLIYRLLVINILLVAGLVAAWQSGWLLMVWDFDTTPVSKIIAGMFLLGIGSTAYNAWRAQGYTPSARVGRAFDRLRDIRLHRIEHLHWLAEWITRTGFLGTVIGFAIALSAVGVAGSDDTTTITGMLGGMKVALGATIIGCAAGMWIEVNYLHLRTAIGTQNEG